MPREGGRILDYRPVPDDRQRASGVWVGRLFVLSGLYPIVFLVALHGLWAWEYAVNGEPPIPPHHGPDNRAMAVLYNLVAFLFLGGFSAAGMWAIGFLVVAMRARSTRVRWLAG